MCCNCRSSIVLCAAVTVGNSNLTPLCFYLDQDQEPRSSRPGFFSRATTSCSTFRFSILSTGNYRPLCSYTLSLHNTLTTLLKFQNIMQPSTFVLLLATSLSPILQASAAPNDFSYGSLPAGWTGQASFRAPKGLVTGVGAMQLYVLPIMMMLSADDVIEL